MEIIKKVFYGYLNLESTKTLLEVVKLSQTFYGYLNLESTKTITVEPIFYLCFTVT